jgi:hypothetical protein
MNTYMHNCINKYLYSYIGIYMHIHIFWMYIYMLIQFYLFSRRYQLYDFFFTSDYLPYIFNEHITLKL